MRKEKQLFAATIVMVVPDVMLAFWGLLLLLMPDQVLSVSSQSFLMRNWVSLKLSDGRITEFITYYMRFWGLEGLLMAVIITILTLIPYRKGVRWAWISIAITSSIGWIGAIVLDVQLGLLSIIYIDAVPLAIVYCSLGVSVGTVFGRSQQKMNRTAAL